MSDQFWNEPTRPAVGHMPFPGHRTQAKIERQAKTICALTMSAELIDRGTTWDGLSEDQRNYWRMEAAGTNA